MTPSTECPTRDEWRQFAGAALPRARYEAIDGHLGICLACQETLAELDGTTAAFTTAGWRTRQFSISDGPIR